MKFKALIIFLGLSILNIFTVANAETPVYEEGKQYQSMPPEVVQNVIVQDHLKKAQGKVQVLEFFSYGCDWCHKLDPHIEKWRKNLPDYVQFERVPVEFQPSWRPLTKAYYAAIDLKALDKIHTPLFDAVHIHNMPDSSDATLQAFFEKQGISAAQFTKMFNSFDVNRKQQWASAMTQAYKMTSVPAVVVQGPSGVFISTMRMAGSEENLLHVLNYLVEKEHAAANQSKQ